MSLCLVLHDLGDASAAVEKAFFESIFEIAPEHWRMTGQATLVATGVSPTYLRNHLLRSLSAEARQGVMLTVTGVSPDAAWHNLPPEGEAWLREILTG